VLAGAGNGLFGRIPPSVLLILTVFIFGSCAVALLGGFWGLFLAPPVRWPVHLLFLSVIVFLTGMHTLSFGHSRYHLPLVPLLLLYAASALLQGRSLWARRTRPAFWLATVVCLTIMGSWVWEAIMVDTDRFLKLFN
jgi:hypothetical protein